MESDAIQVHVFFQRRDSSKKGSLLQYSAELVPLEFIGGSI